MVTDRDAASGNAALPHFLIDAQGTLSHPVGVELGTHAFTSGAAHLLAQDRLLRQHSQSFGEGFDGQTSREPAANRSDLVVSYQSLISA